MSNDLFPENASDERLILFGWIMFTISGFFFVALGLRDGDWFTLGSAATWLAGCAFFITSHVRGN